MRAVRIPLTQGLYALVDSKDAAAVRDFSWHLKTGGAPDKVYAQASMPTVDGRKRSVLLHRWLVGARPGEIVDHRSGDTLDCRRKNLRVTSTRGNAMNVTHSTNQRRGGYKGVSWNDNAGKWEAHIAAGPVNARGRRSKVYLGLFTDPRKAAKAYDRAARECFGEFASLNFP
jgi:AP2 domain-containing protein/HNH endonuclease